MVAAHHNGDAERLGPAHLDRWSEALVSTDATIDESERSTLGLGVLSWLISPEPSGSGPVLGAWLQAAIESDPDAQAWVGAHQQALVRAATVAAEQPDADPVAAIIDALYDAEGGGDTVADVQAEADRLTAEQAGHRRKRQALSRLLPDGLRLNAVLTEQVARSPVTVLSYPSAMGAIQRTVLRDARLGTLAELADRLAERYLVAASEVVACVLTGRAPRVSPVRVGVRFRSFEVGGLPVTANSRLVFDVDPQMEPADLARAFAHWQKASHVGSTRAAGKLADLAGNLVGRVWAEDVAVGREPGRRVQPENESAGMTVRPRGRWESLAAEIGYDPRLIKHHAVAVAHLLLPFDARRAPRWLLGR